MIFVKVYHKDLSQCKQAGENLFPICVIVAMPGLKL